MPNFTIQILASLFSLVVILEQGVQWYFSLQLSAITLILGSVPVVLGMAFTAPALYLMAMSIWNQRGIVGEALKQTMTCSSFAVSYLGRRRSYATLHDLDAVVN